MRKWTWPIVVLIAVAVPTTGGLWPDAAPAQASASAVEVSDDAFTPAEITVAPGTTVTWSNTSQNAPHSAKAQDGSFDTGYIMPGEQGQFTFDTPGEFPYYCEPHPYKTGVVRVQ